MNVVSLTTSPATNTHASYATQFGIELDEVTSEKQMDRKFHGKDEGGDVDMAGWRWRKLDHAA